MIYNTIHQSWSSKTIPAKYLKIKIQNKKFLKDFKFKLWTDDENNFFIKNKYPSFYKIYENYNHYINRVDAVRYFYLYEYGGLYLDLDIIIKKDITKLLSKNKCCLFSQNAINDYFSVKKYKEYIDPMIMYSPPKNKFLEKLIKKLHTNGNNKKYNNVYDNMEVAGPAFLTKTFTINDHVDIISNKIVTEKNLKYYNDVYGIHLCDNNWVK
jgi:mannosyltransferase OCH1-like enzyme